MNFNDFVRSVLDAPAAKTAVATEQPDSIVLGAAEVAQRVHYVLTLLPARSWHRRFLNLQILIEGEEYRAIKIDVTAIDALIVALSKARSTLDAERL